MNLMDKFVYLNTWSIYYYYALLHNRIISGKYDMYKKKLKILVHPAVFVRVSDIQSQTLNKFA